MNLQRLGSKMARETIGKVGGDTFPETLRKCEDLYRNLRKQQKFVKKLVERG